VGGGGGRAPADALRRLAGWLTLLRAPARHLRDLPRLRLGEISTCGSRRVDKVAARPGLPRRLHVLLPPASECGLGDGRRIGCRGRPRRAGPGSRRQGAATAVSGVGSARAQPGYWRCGEPAGEVLRRRLSGGVVCGSSSVRVLPHWTQGSRWATVRLGFPESHAEQGPSRRWPSDRRPGRGSLSVAVAIDSLVCQRYRPAFNFPPIRTCYHTTARTRIIRHGLAGS
jgi:hypothetical protein